MARETKRSPIRFPRVELALLVASTSVVGCRAGFDAIPLDSVPTADGSTAEIAQSDGSNTSPDPTENTDSPGPTDPVDPVDPVDPPEAVTPTAPDLIAEHDTGVSSQDNLTNRANELTFQGTGEPGATVFLRDEDISEPLGQTTVANDGTWSVTTSGFTAADGVLTQLRLFIESQTSSGSSSRSATADFTIDREPPVAPDAAVLGGNVTRAEQPMFIWEPSNSNDAAGYRYAFEAEPTGATAVADTSYTVPEPLSDGTYTFNVQQQDLAGNWSTSGTVSVQIATRFITEWSTAATNAVVSASDQIQLPLASSGTYNFTVDWGDGTSDTITAWDQPETLHTYPADGNYVVTISGVIRGFGFGRETIDTTDAGKLIDVRQWGTVILRTDGAQFQHAVQLSNFTAPDTPELSSITRLDRLFYNATLFNADISDWDVSAVTNMRNAFADAINFNQDIGSWNPERVTNMSRMFSNAASFNQDISGWNTSRVEFMDVMFGEAASFNQDLAEWDVSNVTDMSDMFADAISFNGDISAWDTRAATDMGRMFVRAENFNRDISGWDTSAVDDMSNMFDGATAFDQDLSSWCVTQIASEPSDFATSSALQPANVPVWGTCP